MNSHTELLSLFITHASPEATCIKLWAQMDTESQEQIDSSLMELEAILEAGEGRPHPGEIRPGDMCCAKSSEDGKWYRAKVTDLSSVLANGTVGVKFVDYGNFEIVSVNDVRTIVHPICTKPPQATEFILADVRPIGSSWEETTIERIKDMICYQDVQGIIIGTDGIVPKICIFIPVIAPHGFANYLADLNLARLDTPDKYIYRNIPVGKTIVAFTSNVVSPSEFWIHSTDTDQELENLQAELEKFESSCPKLTQVLIGAPCVTQFSEDGSYYRAQILTENNNNCLVLFVDYGNTEMKKVDELFAIPASLLAVPVQGIKCTLKDSSQMMETAEVIKSFQDLVQEKQLKCNVVAKIDESYVVDVIVDERNVMSNLQDNRRKKSVTPPSNTAYDRKTLDIDKAYEVKVSNAISLSTFYCQEISSIGSLVQLTKQLEIEMNAACQRVIDAELVPGFACAIKNETNGVWYRVEVKQIIELGLVEVHYVDYGFVEIVSASRLVRLPSAYARSPPALAMECALKGYTHIQPDLVDDFERLAGTDKLLVKVEEELDGKIIVDLHNVLTSPHMHINLEILLLHSHNRPVIPESSLSDKEQVYVVNVDDDGTVLAQLAKIPVETLDRFQEDLNAYYGSLPSGSENKYNDNLFHAGEICCAKFSDDDLFYRGKIKSESRNTNTAEVFFVDYGNSESKAYGEIKTLAPKFVAFPCQVIRIRIADLAYSVGTLRDNLMDTTIEVRIVQKGSRVHSVVLTNDPTNDEIKNKLVAIKPEPKVVKKARAWDNYTVPNLRSKEEVIVTHVVNPHHVCCQLQRSSVPLRELFKEISEHCSSEDKNDILSDPAVGQPCLAIFFDEWYRAEVKRVINPTTFEVCYIDFGNTKELNVNMLKNIPSVFLTLPKQAIICKMDKIPDEKWTLDEKNTLEKLIREKAMFAVFNFESGKDEPYTITLLDESQRSMNEAYLTQIRGPSLTPQSPGSWQSNSVPNEVNKPFRGQNDFNAKKNREMFCNGDNRRQQQNQFVKNNVNGNDDWSPKKPEPRVSRSNSEVENFQPRNKWDHNETQIKSPPKSRGDWEQNNWRQENNNNGWGQKPQIKETANMNQMSTWDNATVQKQPLQHTPFSVCASESPSTSNDKKFIPIQLTAGQTKEVDVSHIYSPSEFCVQLKENQDELQRLIDLLAESYESGATSLTDVKINAPCCAQYSEDNCWYRAKVTSVKGDDVDLLFVDYGNTESVKFESVKELKRELLKFPTMALFCSLDNVTCVKKEWSAEDIDTFSDLTMDHSLTMEIIQQTENNLSVNLIDPVKSVSIANELISSGIAKSTQPTLAECIKDMEITSGLTSDVNMSWFVTPTHFYLQMTKESENLNALMDEIQEFYSDGNKVALSVPEWREGMACVAQFTEDDVWYRARIVTIAEPNRVSVVYVDFGNQETLDKSRVRGVSTKFVELPAQAIKCRLKGIRPVGSSWTKIPRGKIDGYFSISCSCTFYASHNGCYLVDVFSNKLSAAQELVNDGFATPTSTNPSVTSNCSGEIVEAKTEPNCVAASNDEICNPFPPVRQPDWKVGDYRDIVVCSLGVLDRFWCRLLNSIEKPMATRLTEHYAHLSEGEQKLVNPKKGTPCVVKSARDDQWYRALVLNRPSPSKLNVSLVDTGMEETISITQAKVIAAEFLIVPIEAFACSMHNVPSNIDLDDFIHATYNKELVAQLESCTKDAFSVTLFDVSQKDERNLNEILTAIVSNAEPSTEVTPPSPKPENKLICSMYDVKCQWQLTNDHPEDILELLSSFNAQQIDWSVGEDKVVVLSGLGRPNKFWCHLASSVNSLDDTCRRLEQFYANSTDSSLTKFSRCTPCVMKSSVNSKWYRASIVRQQSLTDVEVFLVDVGLMDDVPMNELREMVPEFLDLPPEAFCCTLNGIDDSDVTEALVSQFFTLVGEFLTAKLENMSSDGVYDVSLFDLSTGTPENILLRVKGNGDLQPGTQFLPAEINWQVGEIKDVKVSGLGLPDQFWCQLLENEMNFEKLTTQMENYYNSLPDDKLSVIVPVVGKAAAVQSHTTKKWFRALIKSVTHSSKVVVSMVDTGEWEKVTINQVKAIASDLMAIPVMAVECRLGGMPPNSEVRKMGYNFFNLIVDKKLKARLDVRDGAVLEVTLFDCVNGDEIDINERLVSLYQGKLYQENEVLESRDQNSLTIVDPTAAVVNVKDESSLVENKTSVTKIDTDSTDNVDLFPVRVFTPGKRMKGGTSHIGSPGQFWIQLDSDATTLTEATEQLSSIYVECDIIPALAMKNAASGSACAAIYSGDGDWYRGKILAVELNDVHVQFVDYGNSDTVQLSAVRKLTPELLLLPIMALQCELAGVCQQEDDWSVEAIEQFEELVTEKSLVIEIVSQDSDKHTVKLFDMGFDIAIEMERKGFATLKEGYKSGTLIPDNSINASEGDGVDLDDAVKSDCGKLQLGGNEDDDVERQGECRTPTITITEPDDDDESSDEDSVNVICSSTPIAFELQDDLKTVDEEEEDKSKETEKSTSQFQDVARNDEDNKDSPSNEELRDRDVQSSSLNDSENIQYAVEAEATCGAAEFPTEDTAATYCNDSVVSDQSGGFDTSTISVEENDDSKEEDENEVATDRGEKNVELNSTAGDESKLSESTDNYQASVSQNLDSSSILEASGKESSFVEHDSLKQAELDVSCTTASSSFEWDKSKVLTDDVLHDDKSAATATEVSESEEISPSPDSQTDVCDEEKRKDDEDSHLGSLEQSEV